MQAPAAPNGTGTKALRIGVIQRYFMRSGGAEGTTLSLLRMLGRTGHSTTLYTLKPPAHELRSPPCLHAPLGVPPPFCRVRMPVRGPLRRRLEAA